MSEYDYDHNWGPELLAAGITPTSTPISLRGVIQQIISTLGTIGGGEWGLASTAFFVGSGTPVGHVLPDGIGDIYVDDTTPALYQATGLANTNWSVIGGGGGSGTVTSVSVVSANGLAGTVATPTVTPAITLSTSVTGLLKGNGTAISAASAGTDYLTPSGNGSALTGITAGQVSGAQAGPLTGDVTTSGAAATVVKINGTSLAGLATGLLKNTTGTGVPVIATAGTDYPATGVITAGGPTGASGSIPVLTYNANGQLTAVSTAATVGTVAATDATIVIGGTATAPTIGRAALTGDVTTAVNVAALQNTTAVQAVVQHNPAVLAYQSVTFF